jgi:YbgC/YbaW family acyl-CoA thioester hydrolase
MAQLTIGLRIRGDDVDRTGAVAPTRLLSLLEHARWEALRNPDLGMDQLMQGGHKLVVRAQRLELGARAVFGDEVQIRLWYRAIGRTSLEMGQDIHAQGQMIAQAIVTAVHVGPDGRPTPVPEGLRGRVVAEPLPDVLVNATVPNGEPPLDAFLFRHTVRPSETDVFGHINHAGYLDLFEDARYFGESAQAFAPGWVAGLPLQRVVLDYRQEVKAAQTVTVHLWPLAQPHALGCELTRDDGPTTRATLWVRPPA